MQKYFTSDISFYNIEPVLSSICLITNFYSILKVYTAVRPEIEERKKLAGEQKIPRGRASSKPPKKRQLSVSASTKPSKKPKTGI